MSIRDGLRHIMRVKYYMLYINHDSQMNVENCGARILFCSKTFKILMEINLGSAT
jgi:hypothetical protein